MEIKIGKSARVCSTCERAFIHDEDLRSVVRIEDHVLVRKDYCTQCWEPAHGQSAYSTWTPKFYDAKVAEQAPPEAFSPLRQAFYESVEGEDRVTLAMAYLGAQLLRRQKVFRLIKESEDPEGELNLILFNDRIGNRLIEVRDPSLTSAELEDGRLRLMKRLGELEDPSEGEADSEDAVDDEIQKAS